MNLSETFERAFSPALSRQSVDIVNALAEWRDGLPRAKRAAISKLWPDLSAAVIAAIIATALKEPSETHKTAVRGTPACRSAGGIH